MRLELFVNDCMNWKVSYQMRGWTDRWKRKLGPAQYSFVGSKQKSSKNWVVAGRDERAIREPKADDACSWRTINFFYSSLRIRFPRLQFPIKFFAVTIDKEFDSKNFFKYSADEHSIRHYKCMFPWYISLYAEIFLAIFLYILNILLFYCQIMK